MNFFSFFIEIRNIKMFGKKKDAKTLARENQRDLKRANRDLERDRTQFERQEKQLEKEIKAAAKKGDKSTCAVLAKQLVNLRKNKARSHQFSAQINGVGMQMKAMQSQQTMAIAMGKTSKIMTSMNKQMNPQELHKVMQNFSAENAKFEMTGELLDDAMDDAFDVDEGETDAVITQVLDEIGVEISGQLVGLKDPSTSIPGSSSKVDTGPSQDEIAAQMKALGIQM